MLAALRGGNERDLVVGGELACGPVGFRDYRLINGYGDALAGRGKQLGYELPYRVSGCDLRCLTVQDDFHSKYSFKYKKTLGMDL